MRLLATAILSTICASAAGQNYVYTEHDYTDASGRGVIIQNSLPKGGGTYTDSTGRNFLYVIFWSRVVNETTTPLDLEINFPADSFAIPFSDHSYVKLFLPPDTMTASKVFLYDYGITDLNSFLDASFGRPTRLQRTINPSEDCYFYIGALFYQARGSVRAELVSKEGELFYRINLLGSSLISCGRIVSEK